MKIGDKVGNHPKIQSTDGYSISENALTGRNVKDIKGNIFQMVGDYSLWFYIKDIEQELNYEIY